MKRRMPFAVWLVVLLLTAAAGDRVPDIAPPPGAHLPLDLPFLDETGRATTIAQSLNSHPGVLVFADWTCSALCGTTLGQAAMTLRDTGLVPGRDYAFIAIGIDPRDSVQDAARMKAVHLSDAPRLNAASHFLSGDADTIHRTLDAVGYHAIYLPEQDQFAHPAALLLASADGRLMRVLPSFMLDPEELRAALTTPTPLGSLEHRVLLICHALLSQSRGGWVPDALRFGAVATMLAVGGGLLLLHRRGRR